MTVEELLVSIMNPNASDADFRVEVRKSEGYWFVDAVEDATPYPGFTPLSIQNYSHDLQSALSGLFRMQAEMLREAKNGTR